MEGSQPLAPSQQVNPNIQPPIPPIHKLPNEILLLIFKILPINEVINTLPLVCKRWTRLSRHEIFWSQIIHHYWPIQAPQNNFYRYGMRCLRFREMIQSERTPQAHHWTLAHRNRGPELVHMEQDELVASYVTYSDTGTIIMLHQLATGVVTHRFHLNHVNARVVILRGNILVVGAWEGSITVIDKTSGTVSTFDQIKQETSIVFLDVVHGNLLFSSENFEHECQVWNLNTLSPVAVLRHANPITAITFFEDFIITGDNSGLIRVWEKGKMIFEIAEHKKKITWLKVHNRILYACCTDLRAWSLNTGKELFAAPEYWKMSSSIHFIGGSVYHVHKHRQVMQSNALTGELLTIYHACDTHIPLFTKIYKFFYGTSLYFTHLWIQNDYLIGWEKNHHLLVCWERKTDQCARVLHLPSGTQVHFRDLKIYTHDEEKFRVCEYSLTKKLGSENSPLIID